MSSKDLPSIFWYFATGWMLKKPKGPPFTFFGTMRLWKILIFRFFFENFLMSPKGRSFNFLIFCNKLDFQKAQRLPPFTILKTFRFLSLGYSANFRRSVLLAHRNPCFSRMPVLNKVELTELEEQRIQLEPTTHPPSLMKCLVPVPPKLNRQNNRTLPRSPVYLH